MFIFRFIKRYPLSMFTVAVILYLSFFKPPKGPVIDIGNIDKLAHFCMYAGFCSVVWLEYFLSHNVVSRLRVAIGGVIAPIIFSGIIEVLQSTLTTYRGMDWYDLLFNSIGVLFAALFAKFFIYPKVTAYKTKKKSN